MKIIILAALLFHISVFQSLAQDSRIWSTYYGGTLYDVANCVATDDSGNVYLAGFTDSPTSISSNGFQNTFGGGTYDAFLAKFDAGGNRLWATYYGSNNNDYAYSIAIDKSGNIYISGGTSSTSGVASGGFQNTYGGGSYDAMLVKFSPNGNRLWSTYYGGTGWEEGYSVSTDTSGNVFMAGFTNGNTGIASGGHQNTFGGGTYDSFLVKFDSTGTRLWSTYYGGSGNEGYDGNSVATDSQGNVYLTGWTSSSNGISSSGFQNTIGGGNDAFLAKFNPSGIRLWATYYGGTGSEGGISNILYGKNVAVDQTGNVFLSGTTSSTSSIASGGFQELYGGGSYDCYLAKFDSNGVRSWSTYYGGMGDDRGWGVATDQSGNAYLSGRTNSGANISSAGFQNSISGLSDAFLASFSTTGNRICATYFGGSSVEWAYTPAVDPSGNIYLPGFTASTNGIGSNGFQNVYASGTYDGFLAKFTPCGSSSINEQMNTDNSFSIFPNPISNQTTLTSTIELKNATITITDNLGNEVQKRNNINGRTVDINREFIASGIYFLKLTMDQKSIFTGKIVIID